MEREIIFIYLLIQAFFMLGLSMLAFKMEYFNLAVIFLAIGALNLLALSVFMYDIWLGR
jgi:hypothetical protein